MGLGEKYNKYMKKVKNGTNTIKGDAADMLIEGHMQSDWCDECGGIASDNCQHH